MLNANHTLNHASNRAAQRNTLYGERQRAVLEAGECAAARREIAGWPGYRVSPLHALPGLAAAAGFEQLWYKDEAGRFDLGSFKALGGAFAVASVLLQALENAGVSDASSDDLLSGRYRDITSQVTVSCATDGNHGRSVAWGAQRFGCRCIIYIHATVSDGRKKAIEHYGAEVIRTSGNYDDSVRQAAADAERHQRIVVSDTSYPGYMTIPRYVMQGYTVLADEAIEQLAGSPPPTHLFLQAGVGGFAAAVLARFWEHYGRERPRTIVVDPERAACVYQSLHLGQPSAVDGDLDTIMAGLACGEVSPLAWEILQPGCDDALTVNDEAAADTMRLLANGGERGDPPIVAGESAVAGLAAALLARQAPELSAALALDSSSRVLVIGTEGDTDPELYQQIVGRSASQVLA